MRLLYRTTGGFALTDEYVKLEDVPKYGILSHTWLVATEEVNFDDMINGKAPQKPSGYAKIQFCAEQAARDNIKHFWVDTCCINRNSGPELQEAITSMFNWYQKAARCYVYLADVSVTVDDSRSPTQWESSFRASRWFTRGWTLQELLAPTSVQFYSSERTHLGDKVSLEQWVHETTKIPHQALRNESLSNFTVAEKLSWAQCRETTRPEDRAYSLLGILSIFMPLIYGEGEDHAFTRLQAEIGKTYAELEILPVSSSAAFNSRDNPHHSTTCLPNTRVEIMDEIRTWADESNDRSIYWLNGIAGTGKSTIARTVAREHHDRRTLAGSFFFSKGGGDAGHAGRLFTTLAVQLANKIPSVKQHICTAIREHKDIAHEALRDQWEELIINPLAKLRMVARPRLLLFVIDALDECDNERDIGTILKLLAMTTALKSVHLQVFITSRPEIPIRYGFQQISEDRRQGFVLHDISPTLIDRDLTLYFETNLTVIRGERRLSTDWPSSVEIARLVEISCGLFIWASTACLYIRDGKQMAPKRIAKLISGIGPSAGPEKQLDQIYITVLREAINQDYDDDEQKEIYSRLRSILGTIVTLFSPLTVVSLASLLDIEPQTVNQSLADLHTILVIPDSYDRPIRLHHPSFRDFLLDKSRCSDLDFWIDAREAHRTLAECSIRLMSKRLETNICRVESPGVTVGAIDKNRMKASLPEELQYACLYWAEHFRRGDTHLRDDDYVHIFYRTHFLQWLEAINLMRRSSEMAAIIRMYQSLLVPADNSKQIPFVKDSRRLMYSFQSKIEQTPLQVYCSALAFLRPYNQLRDNFWSQLHPWIKQVVVADADAPEVKDEYNYVGDLAFTPDGRQIASGSLEEWVRVWDVETMATISKYQGQTDKVSSISISRDGKRLASGSDDFTVMVWDMESKATLYILTQHSRWVNTVTFSPDGKFLASGSMDETVRISDAESGREIDILQPKLSGINSIAFSPDGSTIALGTVDQLIPLWELRQGKQKNIRLMLDGHGGPINSVRFSPNGKRIASGSDDMTVRIWDVKTGAELKALRGHLKTVWTVAFCRDGRKIASGSADKTIRLWDSRTGDLLRILEGSTSGLNAVAFSPNDKLLAGGSFNDEVRLWNVDTGALRGKLPDFDIDQGAASQKAALLGSNINASTTTNSKAHGTPVTCLLISPDGRSIASGSNDTLVKLWTKEGVEIRRLDGHARGVSDLLFSRNGKWLASASPDGTVRLWDSNVGSMLQEFQCHSQALRLLHTSDDILLASSSADESISVRSASTGIQKCHFKGREEHVKELALSPNDKFVASCSVSATLSLWETAVSEEVCSIFQVHEESVNSIAFSPDSRFLATSSSDRTVKVWDMNGNLCNTFNGHELPVNSAAFSNDTKRVVSGSDDGTVRIWNIETEASEEVIRVGVTIRRVAFSSCGRYIETDRGRLGIRNSLPPGLASNTAHTTFVAEDWIRRGNVDTLWLPKEYHATSVAAWEDLCVLGHASGAISFVEFRSWIPLT